MTDLSMSPHDTSLMFPAFMYGDRTTCRRKMKAEAKKWAKCYAEGRPFPEPKLIPVPPGSIMFIDETTAHWVASGFSFTGPNMVTINKDAGQDGLRLQWRPYLLHDLEFEIEWHPILKLSKEQCFAFRRRFIPFVCQYAWGAISAATLGCLHNSFELAIPRIEAVLRFWEPLDTLKYADVRARPVSLAEFMKENFEDIVVMWVDQPTGNIRLDLPIAIKRMQTASADKIHERLLERLHEHVEVQTGLAHRDWLKSDGVIESGLETYMKTYPDYYRDMAAGNTGEFASFLVTLERLYGPRANQTDPATPAIH